MAELLTAAAELNTDRTKELSGSNTPLESMPRWWARIMQASPSTHFVSFAQAILYRGAGFVAVWPHFVFVVLVGGLFF